MMRPPPGSYWVPGITQIAWPMQQGSGTVTLPSLPRTGDVIVVCEFAAQDIASVLPTGGGATWAQMAYRATDGGTTGAVMYRGVVGSAPSTSVVVTATGNVADFLVFVLRGVPSTLDQTTNVLPSGGSLTASIAPSARGFAVAMIASRGSAGSLVTPRWQPLLTARWRFGGANVVVRPVTSEFPGSLPVKFVASSGILLLANLVLP